MFKLVLLKAMGTKFAFDFRAIIIGPHHEHHIMRHFQAIWFYRPVHRSNFRIINKNFEIRLTFNMLITTSSFCNIVSLFRGILLP